MLGDGRDGNASAQGSLNDHEPCDVTLISKIKRLVREREMSGRQNDNGAVRSEKGFRQGIIAKAGIKPYASGGNASSLRSQWMGAHQTVIKVRSIKRCFWPSKVRI